VRAGSQSTTTRDDALLSFADLTNYNGQARTQFPETIAMKKISIAFLAAVSIATFGCKKKGGADVVAKMNEFKERMCACKDKACAEKVNDDLMKWSTEQSKGDKEAKGTDEDNKKIISISEDMSKCQQKLNDTGAGAPPPAAGSADTGSAAAPPAAGSGDTGSAAAPPAGGSADGSAAGSAK
jgi:hypothetical protein